MTPRSTVPSVQELFDFGIINRIAYADASLSGSRRALLAAAAERGVPTVLLDRLLERYDFEKAEKIAGGLNVLIARRKADGALVIATDGTDVRPRDGWDEEFSDALSIIQLAVGLKCRQSTVYEPWLTHVLDQSRGEAVYLTGHSLGGHVQLSAAIQNLDRISRCVVYNAPGFARLRWHALLRQTDEGVVMRSLGKLFHVASRDVINRFGFDPSIRIELPHIKTHRLRTLLAKLEVHLEPLRERQRAIVEPVPVPKTSEFAL